MRVKDLCMSCMQEKGAVKICPHCGWPESTAPASPLHLPPATVLRDRFIVGRVLGQGFCGISYMGFDILSKQVLVIKEYMPASLASRVPGTMEADPASAAELRQAFREGLRRFLEEGEGLKQFSQDAGIESVLACLEENQTAYMIMKYIKGRTLLEHLSDPPGIMSFDEIVKLLIPVLGALNRVHRAGILHRGISPESILVDDEGRAWLIDFANARNAVAEKLHSPDKVLRNGYAACEQHYSLAAQGSWTDVYGIAATIYRAIAGQAPPGSLARVHQDKLVFPSRLDIEIPDFAEAALLKALAVRANDRYQRISEFANDLRRARSDEDESRVETGEQGSGGTAPQPPPAKQLSQPDALWGAQLAQYSGAETDALWGDLSEKYSGQSADHHGGSLEFTAAAARQAPGRRPEGAGQPQAIPADEPKPADFRGVAAAPGFSGAALAPEGKGEAVAESAFPPPSVQVKGSWAWLFTRRNLIIMLIMILLGITVGLMVSVYKSYLAPEPDLPSGALPNPPAAIIKSSPATPASSIAGAPGLELLA